MMGECVVLPAKPRSVNGGAMKDHRGGEKLYHLAVRLGTGRIVDAASRDEPRAGLAVTADTR